MLQPTAQMGIAGCPAQGDALQQPQAGRRRQPAVLTHPAVDAEQGQGQAPAIEADGDQMGEGSTGPGAPEQMQMAVFAIAAMAVVVALATASRIPQVTRRVVLLLERRGCAGEGAHQGTLAFNQAQPVVKRLPGRSRTGQGVVHQREGPQPPSWAPQP